MSSIGTPSTTMSGLLTSPLLNVPKPRIRMEAVSSMAPLVVRMLSPGTAPCNALATSCCGRPAIVLFKSTVETAPVKLAFFCTP